MPGIGKQSQANSVKDIDDQPLTDYDPEDDFRVASDSEDQELQEDESGARQHYVPASKSILRQRRAVSLDPQYEGSKTSRKRALDEERGRDPLEGFESDESSDVNGALESAGTDDDGELSGSSSDDSQGSSWDGEGEDKDVQPADNGSFNREDGGIGTHDNKVNGRRRGEIDRDELRRIMNDERKSVAISIAEANQADAEKGRAVKRQRQTFDALLNSRIRLQQGLIATNAMTLIDKKGAVSLESMNPVEGAEQSAMNLWNTIDLLRSSLHEARTGSKRKRLEVSTSTSNLDIWSYMGYHEAESQPHRRSVLQKWSTKTQPVTMKPAFSSLNQTARQPTVLDVIDDQLSNPARLVKRTRLPRSCAPTHVQQGVTESEDIFDDADFYGVMLKELLEQRSADAASSTQVDFAAQQWQAARQAGKVKKQVDTKASKGRKMKYTVHEKLQNFMAPEDRGTWGERQVDELFGSLLGREIVLGESTGDVDGMDGTNYNGDDEDMAEEEALRLFRS